MKIASFSPSQSVASEKADRPLTRNERNAVAADILRTHGPEWEKQPPSKADVIHFYDKAVYPPGPSGAARRLLDIVDQHSGRSTLLFHIWANEAAQHTTIA